MHSEMQCHCGQTLARFLLALLLFLWPLGRDALGAEVDKAKELVYKVQAAFLKNFGDFTVWPQGAFTNASAPFVLGVFGNDQFAEVAQREFKDEKVQGRTVFIHKCKDVADAEKC